MTNHPRFQNKRGNQKSKQHDMHVMLLLPNFPAKWHIHRYFPLRATCPTTSIFQLRNADTIFFP